MLKDNNINPCLTRIHDVQLDADYSNWIVELKARYLSAQLKAAVKVNAEKLLFNWQLVGEPQKLPQAVGEFSQLFACLLYPSA